MNKSDIKIIFWGTSEFAIPPLEALLNEGYSIAAVITTPDKPAGRKQLLTPSPVKICAEKHHIKILQLEKLLDANLKSPAYAETSAGRQILNLKSDIFVVASYGKIIPADILALPKYGALNIHPSLLPHWRGPSPIQYTILNGDMKTGVTIMKMDEKMDHGPIITNNKLQITNNPTYLELHDTLATMSAELLIETLPKCLNGEITPKPQNESEATYSKILKKEDGHIDWSRPAEEIERMVRAFTPWPGAYSFWRRDDKKLKISILQSITYKVQSVPNESIGMIKILDRKLTIQTGNDALEIFELQLEGKKPTDARSFLNGYPDISGSVLT